MDADTRRSGRAFLESQLEFARLLDHRVAVTGELFRGDPLEALAAASEHMDLLAIGTHKTGFVQGRIVGSRFIQLAGLAFSPVAFVPNSAGRRRAGVVVGVGDVEADEAILLFAAREAIRTREDLTVIHCGTNRSSDAAVAPHVLGTAPPRPTGVTCRISSFGTFSPIAGHPRVRAWGSVAGVAQRRRAHVDAGHHRGVGRHPGRACRSRLGPSTGRTHHDAGDGGLCRRSRLHARSPRSDRCGGIPWRARARTRCLPRVDEGAQRHGEHRGGTWTPHRETR
jgi:hypothetical protein